jgi:hypothetical protein
MTRFLLPAIVSLSCLGLVTLAGGCAGDVPPPPVTPAGVVLPPEVELTPDEAAAQYRSAQPGLHQARAPYR